VVQMWLRVGQLQAMASLASPTSREPCLAII
jgi:hypothetical protein